MIGSVAVTRIQRYLGWRSDKADEILQEMQDAQDRLEGGIEMPDNPGETFLPWFLTTEYASILTVAGEERIPVPDDFLAEVDDDALWYFNPGADNPEDEWKALKKVDTEFMRGDQPGSGPPVEYSLSGVNLRIGPVPDAAYTLKMIYYATDAMITTGAANKWLTYIPHLIIGEAGYYMAVANGAPQPRIQFFQNMIEENARGLWARTQMRANQNRTFVMGGED